MKKSLLITALLLLTACDAAEESARKAGSMLEANYDTTRKKLSKWIYRWNGDQENPPPPKILANSYCYQVMMDIMCYEEPRQDLGTRLVAYQGSTAYPPDYVPPPAVIVKQEIISYDVPPPFAVASPETVAKAQVSGASGSSVTTYTARPAGPPKGLMPGR